MTGKRTSRVILAGALLLCMAGAAGAQQRAAAAADFVSIVPGEFIMGCSTADNQCEDHERPAHRVRITKKIEMGGRLVTQAQWEAVMGTNPSYFKGPDRPVERVNWNDTQEFIKKMNARQDGYLYRLPTEAEWEYAARAGTTTAYAGQVDDTAWYDKNSGAQTHPVAQKKPNAWGLYDMQGNVQEWVQDVYSETYYNSPNAVAGGVEIDPQGPAPTGQLRVLRGAAWGQDARLARSSSRNRTVAGDIGNFRGFRLVREKQ